MTLTLEIPDDIQRVLAAEADRQGLPLDAYALRVLTAGPGSPSLPKDGPGLVQYWKAAGLLGAPACAEDSPGLARQIRHRAESQGRG